MNYTYQKELHDLWDRSVERYQAGKKKPDSLFLKKDRELIDRIGATPQEVFDFIEDFSNGGEPDFATFAVLAHIRHHYFMENQGGRRSSQTLDPAQLPAKTEAVEGIEWLPRIIPKALAKLRGELHWDIMFCCGGDRAFFRKHDIHPADFLRIVEANESRPKAIIRWVKARSRTVQDKE